jgi:hypothetical protein
MTDWKDNLCVHYRKPSVNSQHELLIGSECYNWSDQKINKLAQSSRLPKMYLQQQETKL